MANATRVVDASDHRPTMPTTWMKMARTVRRRRTGRYEANPADRFSPTVIGSFLRTESQDPAWSYSASPQAARRASGMPGPGSARTSAGSCTSPQFAQTLRWLISPPHKVWE